MSRRRWIGAALAVLGIAAGLAAGVTWYRRPAPAPAEHAILNGISAEEGIAIAYASGPLARDCTDAAIAIILDGKVAYTNAWGREKAASHRYEWGSVSKTVTALITMELVESGKLRLDQPIWEIDPKYETLIPAAKRTPPITVERLLTHTAGITRQTKRGTAAMFWKPAGKYRYSSNGYGVLGDVLRAVSGQTYPELVGSLVNEKIQHTHIAAHSDSFIAPAALVTSNIADFAAFAIGFLDDRFVSAATRAEMSRAQVTMPAAEWTEELSASGPRPDGYGYGFEVASGGATPIIAHSGKNGAKRAFLYLQPEFHRGVVGFCTAKRKNGPVTWWSVTDDIFARLDAD